MSSIQMMPMVFCASLPPCPRLYSDEEKSCAFRKRRSTRLGVHREKSHQIATSSNKGHKERERQRREKKSCAFRKRRSTRLGVHREKSHEIASSSSEPMRKPSSGERKMKATVFS